MVFLADEMTELNKQVSLQASELTRLRTATSSAQEKEARTKEQLQFTQNALNAMKQSLSSLESEANERVRRAETLLETNDGENMRQAREDERALVERSNKEQLLKNRLQEAETSVTVLAEQNLSLVALYKASVCVCATWGCSGEPGNVSYEHIMFMRALLPGNGAPV